MDPHQNQLLKKYLDLFLRWKAFVFACVLLSLPAGLAVYLQTPKIYQSTSLLSYQQQKINPNKMSPDLEADIRDVVSTLTQMVMSRTNLEDIIISNDLFLDIRKRYPMEDVVDMMKNNIQIEPSRDGDVFQIKYSGTQPDKVVKVTNALAGKFIEENLKYREERASETSSYTSNELEMAKVVMDEKDANMRDYKLKHYNELAEQRQINVERLTSLQEQYQSLQESIQEQERTMVMIQDQIANRRQLLASEAAVSIDDQNDNRTTPIEPSSSLSSADRLIQLRAILKNLRVKYTDNHPDVKQTKKLIAKIENDIDQGREVEVKNSPSKNPEQRSLNTTDPMILQLETQLKGISLNIKSIGEEKEQLKKSIAQYEKWVAASPIREAEWSALTREYNELKRHYDFLVSSDLEAKSMLNLERKQKGSQFKIVDSARMPEKPYKPEFVKVLGIAFLLGLGVGLAIPFSIAFFDSSFRDVNDLESELGLQVACLVPLIETSRERSWQQRKILIGLILGAIAALVIIAIFFYYWRLGSIIL